MDIPSLTDRLSPKSAEIAAKVIDGEAIIINLTNGYYYSMDGAGAMVWEAIQAGHRLESIAERLCRRYDVARDVATADLMAVVAQLASEDLVKMADQADGPETVDGHPADAPKLPYVAPALEKFGDMAHFFALDPPLPELDDSAPADEPS